MNTAKNLFWALCLTSLGSACGSEAGGDDSMASTTTSTSTSTTGDDESTGDSSGGDTMASGDGDGDGGETFVPSETGDTGCGTECNIWAENECPEGEKCTAVACEVGGTAWDANVCRPVNGTKAVGDECENMGSGVDGEDDCDVGSMCWGADPDTGLGVCVAFCTGNPDNGLCDGGGDTLCSIYNDGVLPLCLPKCDPLVAECPNGDVCIPHPSGEGFNCVIDSSQGMGLYGVPCQYANSCNEGLLCIDAAAVPEPDCASASGCCSPVCDLSAGETCPGDGQICEAFYEAGAVPPGYENVGICAVPI
jgi:hypothetical protein